MKEKTTNKDEVCRATDRPIVTATAKAMAKILTLVEWCPTEIAFHGLLTKPCKGEYVLEDILIYPQRVTSCTVNTDEIEYGQWMTDLAIMRPEVFDKIRFQAHSHVNMGVTPSGTDIGHQEDIVEMMSGDGYYVFLIINKSLKTYVRVVDFEDNIDTTEAVFTSYDCEFNKMFDDVEKYVKRSVLTYEYK